MKFRLTSGGSRGRGPPPPPPPPPTSFFDQIEARRADKKFLETAPRLPQGLNDRPRRLISRSGSATANIRQLSLGPTLKKHVQQIEGVQRRAARFVKNCYTHRTTRININRININPNDYYNLVIYYYNPVIDYYNPVIDYYNPLLRFEPCLDQFGLLLILCRININQININANIRSSNRLL